jgi:hypothetical protein
MKKDASSTVETYTEDIKLFSGLLKMPLVKLPVRTLLVSLASAKILISPHPSLTSEEFQRMGNVTDIVAPNLFHHLGIQAAVAAHPQAKLWGVGGFERKRKDIRWGQFLDEHTWPYGTELVAIQLAGMPKVNECLFFHPPSRTLFVTDLCFNILDSSGFGAKLIYSIFGTYNRFAMSKLFSRSVTNKDAFQKSLATLFAYDFDNIVVSHGLVVRGNGRAKLEAALRERGYVV